MGSPDYAVIHEPCPRCASEQGLSIQIEYTRGTGRLNLLEVGSPLGLSDLCRRNPLVISESFAFGALQCRNCQFMGFGIVERRNGRFASARYWGETLPEPLSDESADELPEPVDSSYRPFVPPLLQECRNVLSECDGVDRDEQVARLRSLAPAVFPWRLSRVSRACLIVSLWNGDDSRALAQFVRYARRRKHGTLELSGYAVALSEWFATNDDIRRSIGYSGPSLESVVMVLRDSKGDIEWEGEGSTVIEELRQRDW